MCHYVSNHILSFVSFMSSHAAVCDRHSEIHKIYKNQGQSIDSSSFEVRCCRQRKSVNVTVESSPFLIVRMWDICQLRSLASGNGSIKTFWISSFLQIIRTVMSRCIAKNTFFLVYMGTICLFFWYRVFTIDK